MTPDSNPPGGPGRNSGRRLWERVAHPAVQATKQTGNWLRSAFTNEHGHYRVPPRMRSVQVGTTVVAVGALGILATPTGQEPQEPTAQRAQVEQAVQTTSLGSTADTSTADANAAPGEAGSMQLVGKHRDTDGSTPRHDRAPAPQNGGAVRAASSAAPAAATQQDQIDRWITQASKVLKKNGVSEEQLDHDGIRTIIENESGGDPQAVNDWDSNASSGTPSKGLMQTIEPTFQEYAAPGHEDILNPVDNIAAATLYSIDRYGSVSDVPGVDGLNSGGSYEGY